MEAEILDRKGEVLAEFVRRLRGSPVGGQIAQIVLYGSYARGEAGPESDVDVLILTAGPVREVERVAGEIVGDLMLEFSERVEPMIYTVGDSAAPAPFVYCVLGDGQGVYRMNADRLAQEEIRALHELARMYLEEARRKYEPTLEGSRRLTADGAYNAIELAAKAFLRGKAQAVAQNARRRFPSLLGTVRIDRPCPTDLWRPPDHCHQIAEPRPVRPAYTNRRCAGEGKPELRGRYTQGIGGASVRRGRLAPGGRAE